MYDKTLISYQSVYAKFIWCVANLNQRRMKIGKRKISTDRNIKEAADLLKCLEISLVNSTAVFLFVPYLIYGVFIQRADIIGYVFDFSLNLLIIK